MPIRPATYRVIFDRIDAQLPSGDARKARLRELGEAFENLDPHDPQARDAKFDELRNRWAAMLEQDAALRQLMESSLAKLNGTPGEPPSFVGLHELLEEQHFRLAHWKVGSHEVNYRRFFACDTLIGLKMEHAEVFAATHGLLAELIGSGEITGIRLDHIDGLWNPLEYLNRLADLVQRSRPGGGPIWTLVEKILAVDESLPAAWPVHGTTGYEFAASLCDLFLDRADEPAWSQIYGEFTGESQTSRDLTYEDKLFILENMFPNAVSNLATELDNLIEPDWHRRDISLHDLKTGLRHFLACLDVYRTYHMPDEAMAPDEKRRVEDAMNEAIRRNPNVDPVPIRFIGSVITGEYPTADNPIPHREKFPRWVCKLQQATGAIMAKSVEDTHFYRYVRMLGANEVGSHPSRFGQPVEEFHRGNRERLEQTPLCMLTTSTHDTKLSEDARARLFALAELPEEWRAHLQKWHGMNEPLRKQIKGRSAPDAREEYLLYQVLLASWPLGVTDADASFRERLKSYFRKARGEAKQNTSWAYPNEEWHAAGDAFIDGVLDSSAFMAGFLPFAEKVAERGMVFSLAQTVLRQTCPGVPDLYQGNETWDFSLVDPDNRRPVDFAARRKILEQLDARSPRDLVENWQDGGIKMQVVRSLLHLRREFPDLFIKGEYMPITNTGSNAVVAFLRRLGTAELLVVVPRRSEGLGAAHSIQFPSSAKRTWKDVLTGRSVNADSGAIRLGELFSDWPVAVLISP